MGRAAAEQESSVVAGGQYALYVAGVLATPTGRFSSSKEAEAHAQNRFSGQHCRIVDTATGRVQAFNYQKTEWLSEAFFQGIDITSQVVPSPAFIRELHARQPDLQQKGGCYNNCLLTILKLQATHPELRYALALIHYGTEDVAVGHALIEHAGNFYDPTLEHQHGIQALVSYRLLEVLEPARLQQHIADHIGHYWLEQMRQGHRKWPIFRVDVTGARVFEF
ncbi:hypothetical protein D3C75_826870 [compost metagenome]